MVEDARQDSQDEVGQPSTERVSVPQAADHLGTTVDAIRKRVQRGTIPHEKDAAGRVWILLDTGRPRHDTTGHRPDSREDLIDELRDRVRYLERRLDEEREARTEERRRHDTLMAQLTSRIPQIEAPSQEPPTESPGAPRPPDQQTPSEAPESPQMHTVGGVPRDGDTDSPDHHTPSERERPWWRRLFEG
jgi:hypothetical protein